MPLQAHRIRGKRTICSSGRNQNQHHS